MTRHSASEHRRVLIVGGGFSGIGVAIELLSRGERDFQILEKASELGGTWRDNTYPGCACDVPSQLYSFSFAPKADWSRVFAEGPEIQQYLLDVAERFGVRPHVRTNTEVRAVTWDEAGQRWRVDTSVGAYTADVVVLGAGPLHHPRIPDITGRERFAGRAFHTARWEHDHDLAGRRVAVVGTGSSAIQLVPKIQPFVEHLVLFQRTAPWVLPKLDHRYPTLEQAAFRRVPGFRRAYRGAIEGTLELLQLAQRSPATMRRLQAIGTWHLRRQVADPALRRALTPSFTLGCKRLLLSNTYYPAVASDNVTLVRAPLAEITEHGVVGGDGVAHEVDTIVWGTGFYVTDPPIAELVVGRDGRSLSQHWDGSPRAYLGTTIAGFPNLFFMIGPNLGNGHGSAFTLIEAQAKYLADALALMRARGLASVDVRADLQGRYNADVQAALSGTVWNAGGCASYYLDRNGTNSSIYPWTTLDLRRRLRRFDASHYVLRARRALDAPKPARAGRPEPIDLRGAVVAITGGAHGIGRATARQFAAAGATVCIGDLDHAAAEATADALKIHALPLDVARRDAFETFVATIEAELGPIDVLVNNAGVMPTGSFLSEPDSVDAAAMSVNHFGTALGMKLVLPGMIARGRGHVVNVASLAGRIPVPGMATYVASKHATVGLSRAVREEIEGTGVTLTTILPAAVRTRLAAGIPLAGVPTVDPEDVAAQIVRSVRTRAPEVTVPRGLGLAPAALAMLPPWLARLVRRGLRSDRVLTDSDTTIRGAYEASIRDQGERLARERASR